MTTISFTHVSDQDLLDSATRVVGTERRVTADLLAVLGELDARKLYLGQGCSSLFTYCTQVLHLSEHAAYHRIEAARAARRFPAILDLIASGAVTLTTVAMLRPHMTLENAEALLAAASYKSKREVERQIACLAPQPDVEPLVRRVAQAKPPKDGGDPVLLGNAPSLGPALTPTAQRAVLDASATRSRTVFTPIAADRYLLKVTLSTGTHAKLRRAQDLLRHAIPSGDPAAVLDRALTLLVDQLERTKLAKSVRPRAAAARRAERADSRHVSAAVKRAVWARDEGRCAFVGSHGRCTETGFLELHHIAPYAAGGKTTLGNLSLRCRSHNAYEATLFFGEVKADEECPAVVG